MGKKRRASAGRTDTAGADLTALPDERLPRSLKPMLARLGSLPAATREFIFEKKWDGYRALARVHDGAVQLISRNGIDLTSRFPELTATLPALPRQVLLDGEIIAVDRQGHAHFSALQTRMPSLRIGGVSPGASRGRAWDPQRFSLAYMIFDVLHLDGHSLRTLTYIQRRAWLEGLFPPHARWQVPPTSANGAALLARMQREGQEGIIAKRKLSPYLPGQRSDAWIKVKVTHQEEFLIVGFWSSGRNVVSSLLLGYYPSAAAARAHRGAVYCGKVGTGFSPQDRLALATVLQEIAMPAPTVQGQLPRGPGITWCKPLCVAQIRFAEWTHDGSLRHATFLGVRVDKSPHDIVYDRRSAGAP